MKEFEIKGNKVISRSIRTHIFEITEKIPNGFFIWNIGNNMGSDEYIPFCEKLYPGDPNSYEINPETLKTIKLPVDEVKLLRRAAHEGITNKEEAIKAINSKIKGATTERKRQLVQAAIEIYSRITE